VTNVRAKNRIVALALVAVLALMGGVTYKSSDIYTWFCRVSGFGGTPQVAERAPGRVLERTMTIRFNADVAPDLPWRFAPAARAVTVQVGAETLAFYRATNNGGAPITGTAAFNVVPDKAGPYFSKIECFCFTEQTLAPGESADFPVSFFVDPAIAEDRGLDDVEVITLSYTFFASQRPTRLSSLKESGLKVSSQNQ
jgi:cytochrome c oxidase assembly protein subunit 11